MIRAATLLVILTLLATTTGGLAWSQEAASKEKVAAKVGAATITVADVDTIVRRVPGHESFAPEVLTRLQAETLAQLVNKSLAIEHLDRLKFLPDEKPWEARWVRFLADRISDDDARKFFTQHKRDFDGTELRVSHILFQVDKPHDSAATQATFERAKQLRSKIVAGEVTFAAAASEHSAGPSRDRGGDLGFINRRGPMVESFSRAAFALEKGAISEPVVSPFGVHLVQCTEIKPGKLRWEEANRAVREVMSAQLLQRIADDLRPQVKIEYTGESPYIDPTSGRIVK